MREIQDAATDRLCFLVGKGQNQSVVDFVLQSFREYFAAEYLAHHPEADSDKIFASLVLRGGYWANVLQFYFARAYPSFQLQWTRSLVEDSNETQQWINSILKRKFLLSVSAEFRLQKNHLQTEILKEIFSVDTLWTWWSEEIAKSPLGAFKRFSTIETVKVLYNSLSNCGSESIGCLFCVLAELSKADGEAQRWVVDKMQSLVGEGKYLNQIAEIASESGLPVVFDANNVPLRMSFMAFSERAVEFFKLQPTSIQVAAGLSSAPYVDGDSFPIWDFCNIVASDSVHRIQQSETERKRSSDFLRLQIFSFVDGGDVRRSAVKSLLEIVEQDTENSDRARYLRALLRALANPIQANLRKIALDIYGIIPDARSLPAMYPLCGPDSDEFNSDEDFEKFYSERHLLLAGLNRFILDCAASGNEEDIILLSFHPRQWINLVHRGILPLERHKSYENSEWARILKLPKTAINFTSLMAGFHNSTTKKINVVLVAELISQVLGEGCSISNNGFQEVLEACYSSFESAGPEHSTITALKQTIWPPHLQGVLLRLLYSTQDTPDGVIVDIWQHHTRGGCEVPHLRTTSINSLHPAERTLRLLSSGNETWIELGIMFCFFGDFSHVNIAPFLKESLEKLMTHESALQRLGAANISHLIASLPDNAMVGRLAFQLAHYFASKSLNCTALIRQNHDKFQSSLRDSETRKECLQIASQLINDKNLHNSVRMEITDLCARVNIALLGPLSEKDWSKSLLK